MSRTMQVNWYTTNQFGRPFELWYPHSDDLDYNCFGVYILWKWGNGRPKAIYAGKGWIKNRFSVHRGKECIKKHASSIPPIFVTWAIVPNEEEIVYGVEHYIHASLTPCESRAKPTDEPIRVNLPDCFN